MHFFRSFLFLGALLCTNLTLAVTPVEYRVSLTNDSWFPLERHEMKAAAASSVLDVLTRHGDLKLLEGSPENPQDSGMLSIQVILIERAETAQIQLTLDLPGHQSTYVTRASAELSQRDYQGIRRQFESIGQQSAEKLLKRLQQTAGRDAGVQRSLDDTIDTLQRTAEELEARAGKSQGEDRYSNAEAKAQYEKAQALKRQHQFDQAEKVLSQLSQQQGPGTENWRELAQDELNYGLPMMQAEVWTQQWMSPSLSPQERKQLQEKIKDKLEHISDANPDNPERVLQAQRQQDQLQNIGHYMNRSLQSHELAKLSRLRMSLTEHLMTRGEVPTKATVREHLDYSSQTEAYEITNYKKTGEHNAEVQLTHRDMGYEFMLVIGGYDGVNIQPKK